MKQSNIFIEVILIQFTPFHTVLHIAFNIQLLNGRLYFYHKENIIVQSEQKRKYLVVETLRNT